ncbi:hypothetical protein OSTOST_08301, partial [Ostertagia ostertagi]
MEEDSQLRYNRGSVFSTVSRSEMTTSGQSKLPSPLTDQSTPFRVPLKKSLSSVDGAQTTTTGGGRAWAKSRQSEEAFARPGPDDEKWVAQTHDYFDNEKVYVRKPSKPTVGRRLRIGRLQRRRWSSIMREMALRHPLPVNPAPFPLSKAMDELKLRPEKRFTMPHN